MCVMASFKEKANERKEGEEEEKKKKFPKKGELALASSTKGTPTVSLSLSVFSIYLQTKDKRASSSFGAMPEREGEIFSFEASDDANRGRRSKTSSFSYSSTDGRAGAAGSMKPIERSFAFFFAVEIGWLDTLYWPALGFALLVSLSLCYNFFLPTIVCFVWQATSAVSQVQPVTTSPSQFTNTDCQSTSPSLRPRVQRADGPNRH